MSVSPLPAPGTRLRLLPQEADSPTNAWTRWRSLHPLLVSTGLLAGSTFVMYAYVRAATIPGQAHFHLFWVGVLLFFVPASLRLSALDVTRGERLVIVAALGLFMYLPRFLRSPASPLFHDELAHWRAAEAIYRTGTLFHPNPIVSMAQFFPGLHALTAALRELTGLSTVDLAIVLLALLHAIALLGIVMLAESVTGSAQVAGLAALIYSLNPSYMFFDTQYSYESPAIVLFIWVLVAITGMQDTTDRRRRAAWLASGLVLAAGCVVTHHLSSYILAAVLALVTVVTALQAWRGTGSGETVLLTAVFTLAVTAGAVTWLLGVASSVVGYLAPAITGGIGELARMIGREAQGRILFAGSTTPGYERVCAFLSPLIAAGGAAGGLWLLHRRRLSLRLPPARALALFGLLYFPSVPFILTRSGNEGARRSWGFTYVGLCILIAPLMAWLLQRSAAWRPLRCAALRGGMVALLGIVLIGNVSMHINETYRFPGPFVYGSDTRSLTAELLQATRWFRATQGTGRSIVADRYSGLAFGSFGDDWVAAPSPGFPLWHLYFSTRRPDTRLLRALREAGYRYMVVDRQMARYLPRIGMYFDPGEPGAFVRRTPPPVAALSKFERLPWAIKIYQSNNLEIYRLDFTVVDAGGRRGVYPARRRR